MKPFIEWYADRYGPYPGVAGERLTDISERVMKAVGEYMNEIAKPRGPERRAVVRGPLGVEIVGVFVRWADDAE